MSCLTTSLSVHDVRAAAAPGASDRSIFWAIDSTAAGASSRERGGGHAPPDMVMKEGEAPLEKSDLEALSAPFG